MVARCDFCLPSRGFGATFSVHLVPDPPVGFTNSIGQRDAGLPIEGLPEQSVVAISPANSLWLGEIMYLRDPLSRGIRDDIYKLIDRDDLFRTQVYGTVVPGGHDPDKALKAVVDVTETSRLLPISPDFDRSAIFCFNNILHLLWQYT